MSTAQEDPASTFAGGFGFAMIACGGLVAERLSRGETRVAAVAHVLLTLAAIGIVRRHGRSATGGIAPRIVVQCLGAIIGIGVAHYILRSSLATAPWLSERPAQLVNDAVAVFAPLGVVWASSRRPPSTVGLVATLAIVSAYRATASAWHLDSGPFEHTIQDLVSVECAGSALGVTAFRLLVAA